eukprot:10579873-Alexandrium_andersonii.AAC.1
MCFASSLRVHVRHCADALQIHARSIASTVHVLCKCLDDAVREPCTCLSGAPHLSSGFLALALRTPCVIHRMRIRSA